MIKTSVNLYSDDLLPQTQWLTLTRLMLGLMLLIVIGVVGYGFGWWQQQQTQILLQQANNDNQQLTAQKIELEVQIAARKPDAALVAKVELEEQQLALKTRLKDELSQRQELVSQGYSPLLTDLAKVANTNVWLSHISLVQPDHGPMRVAFEGYGRTPQSIPLWIDQLKNTSTLKGYAFSAMTMNQGENQPLVFKLTSQTADKEPSQ